MIRIEFSQEEISALDYERYHYPHPMIQKRMEALFLKSQGYKHQDICRICRIGKTSLVTYLKAYREGGIDAQKRLDFKGRGSALNSHAASLEEHFRKHPPRSVAEAQAVIEDLTGIKRSPTQIRAFMKRLGMSVRKAGFVPGKACDEDKQREQEEFIEKEMQPRLDEAARGARTVFFVDAAHFAHGAFLGLVRCFVRIFIPSPSGRRRFNVLGALNAVTKELVTVKNDTYINAESVCQLLLIIAERTGHGPITLILDNARYQKCAIVRGLAEHLGIELLYLPSYSPNLNLIERFWRFVKKDCLYSEYYKDFGSFKSAITSCIDCAHSAQREKQDSLLTWNFQSFRKVQILPV